MQTCTQTVMDTSVSNITFDEKGVSDLARKASWRIENESYWTSGDTALHQLVKKVKESGNGCEYDCLIGVSGGVDSSYVAHLTKSLGLRPLALHVDNGWNTETAVSNIWNLLNKLDIDLVTEVLPWHEVKDLQRAYIKSGVMDLECVADHAINAATFSYARKYKIKYIITGGNVANEALLPTSWGFDKRDRRNLVSIHKAHGDNPLKYFPTLKITSLLMDFLLRGKKVVPLLNYVNFKKPSAVEFLKSEYGWQEYGRKHGENKFTRFFQEIYLPERFGIDKRKAHFSNQILNGEITREEALTLLEEPIISLKDRRIELQYVSDKLGFEFEELEFFLLQPGTSHYDYFNNAKYFNHSNPFVQAIRYLGKGELNVLNLEKILKASFHRD